MITIRMTPARRMQLAGAGYLLLYVYSQWQPQGLAALLIAVLIALALALLLFRAAMPEPMKPQEPEGVWHLIQGGKQRMQRRSIALRPTEGPQEVR